MKGFFLLAVLLAGCAAPRFSMMIESEPTGAKVFWAAGANEAAAKNRNYIGQTPCSWEGECKRNHTFKAPRIPFYSKWVPGVVIVTAEPPSGSTNLWPQRRVFHSDARFHDGDPIPARLFFDLTRPSTSKDAYERQFPK